MLKRRCVRVACAVSSLLLLAVGCSKESHPAPAPQGGATNGGYTSENNSFVVKLSFEQGPAVSSENIAQLDLATVDGKPFETLTDVEVKPWMAVHGHGAPMSKLKVTALSTTSFKVTGLYFTMSGPWQLIVTAIANGKKDSAKVSIEVP